MLSDSDKGVLVALVPVLENICHATIVVQSATSVSASMATSLLQQMQSDWLQLSPKDSNIIRDFKLAALDKLNDFFPPFSTTSVLTRASALDPCFKLAFLSAREQAGTWASLADELGVATVQPTATDPVQVDQVMDHEFEDEVIEEGSVEIEGNGVLTWYLTVVNYSAKSQEDSC